MGEQPISRAERVRASDFDLLRSTVAYATVNASPVDRALLELQLALLVELKGLRTDLADEVKRIRLQAHECEQLVMVANSKSAEALARVTSAGSMLEGLPVSELASLSVEGSADRLPQAIAELKASR